MSLGYRLRARYGELTDSERDRLAVGIVLVAASLAIFAAVAWP